MANYRGPKNEAKTYNTTNVWEAIQELQTNVGGSNGQTLGNRLTNVENGKADKTYVDTELGKKAKQSDLDLTNQNVASNTSSLADIAKVNNKYVTLVMYGGVADAKYQDPTTKEWYTDSSKTTLATDNTQAFINAITDINNHPDKTLLIDGIYCIRGGVIGINIGSINIRGFGINSSKLIFTNADGGLYFINPYGNGYTYEIFLQDVSFTGNNTCKTIIKGVKCEQFYIHNVYIGECVDHPIDFESLNLTHFSRLDMQNCSKGILLKNTGFVSVFNHNFYNINDSVFELQGSLGTLNIYDGWFESFDKLIKIKESDTTYIDMSTINVHDNHILSTRNYVKLLHVEDGITSINAYLSKFNFKHNKLTLTGLIDKLFSIDFSKTNIEINLDIKSNTFSLTNQPSITAITSNVPFNYQLNINFGDNFGIYKKQVLTGAGNMLGFDSQYNQTLVRGLLNILGDPASLESTIIYDQGQKRLAIHNGSSYQIIPSQAGYVPASTASDVATLKTDLNNLITELKNAKIIS
jgi:hypothetical protein